MNKDPSLFRRGLRSRALKLGFVSALMLSACGRDQFLSTTDAPHPAAANVTPIDQAAVAVAQAERLSKPQSPQAGTFTFLSATGYFTNFNRGKLSLECLTTIMPGSFGTPEPGREMDVIIARLTPPTNQSGASNASRLTTRIKDDTSADYYSYVTAYADLQGVARAKNLTIFHGTVLSDSSFDGKVEASVENPDGTYGMAVLQVTGMQCPAR